MSRTHGQGPKAVVFDLDGTLVDSAPDITRALNMTFEPMGAAPFATEHVHRLIGDGAVAAIKRGIVASGLTLSETEERDALRRFYIAYTEVSEEGRGLYPGAHDLLGSLQAQGIPLAICTNKAEPVALVALKALGIADYFGSIIGARETLAKKPDAAMVLAALAPYAVSPVRAVMVGDSPADYGAGRAAGTKVALVDFGYSRVPVRELGADAVVSSLAELEGVLRGM
jgi:phosphoglycolate phosphatase